MDNKSKTSKEPSPAFGLSAHDNAVREAAFIERAIQRKELIKRVFDSHKSFGDYSSVLKSWDLLMKYGSATDFRTRLDQFFEDGCFFYSAADFTCLHQFLEEPKLEQAKWVRPPETSPYYEPGFRTFYKKLKPALENRLESLRKAEQSLDNYGFVFDPKSKRLKVKRRAGKGGGQKDGLNFIIETLIKNQIAENPKLEKEITTKPFRQKISGLLSVFLDDPEYIDPRPGGYLDITIKNFYNRPSAAE